MIRLFVIFTLGLTGLFASGLQATAETRHYQNVYLHGLQRVHWPYGGSGLSKAMVCNVNGPDGFLTVRAGPGTQHAKARAFNRLAILRIDTTNRKGRWVRVLGAHRTVTPQGAHQSFKDLPVVGWAHDGYLCSYVIS